MCVMIFSLLGTNPLPPSPPLEPETVSAVLGTGLLRHHATPGYATRPHIPVTDPGLLKTIVDK